MFLSQGTQSWYGTRSSGGSMDEGLVAISGSNITFVASCPPSVEAVRGVGQEPPAQVHRRGSGIVDFHPIG
jgi:hypothetical protein